MIRRQSILDDIAREEATLARLRKDQEQTLSRIEELRNQLRSLDRAEPSEEEHPVSLSVSEKIALFRGLFRGRQDVYPKLWLNEKAGKKGYSPACSNEWAAGLCRKNAKPPVKCGDCTNQAFLPVTDKAVQDHLQGRHVMGVYPMLTDDTCWFLAVDFDKESWREDVAAFLETCRILKIPASVERSRSGNGAHVWFFFTEPVQAAVARKMGCYLITETMSRRHQLSMASYDRLFPSQDSLPRGGFGNMIALPLQHEPRKLDNTVFLDDQLAPYPDQWTFLASIARMSPATVQAIADEATRRGKVIGIQMADTGDGDEAPWERPPSGRPRKEKFTGKLPKKVRGVLAQRLFVEKKRLPSPLVNMIKRLAAFQNPEFYKKQSMRLSTAQTPRVIACFEELPEHVAIPRGCLDSLRELLREYDSELVLDDKRCAGEQISSQFQGKLTEVQQQAVDEMLQHEMGIFVAPPGSGKTVVGAYLAAARQTSTLVLVHRKPLLDQWVAQLSQFLGIPPKAIGTIGAGKNKPTGIIDVAMIQSLVRKDEVRDLVANYGHVIIDECHHLPAVSFERVMAEAKAHYITGLTATPYRRDGHQPIILMQCGPVRFSLHRNQLVTAARLKHRLTIRETGFAADRIDGNASIQELYAALTSDRERNSLILADVRRSLREGRSPILLTERKDHLDFFANELRDSVRHLVVLQGGMGAKKSREILTRLATIPDNEERLILATGRYIGEGFDDPRLDTLFLAMPFSWKGTLVQYAGRLHRHHPDKHEVRIYDYVDVKVPMLMRMHEKRLKGFKMIGYSSEDI